MCSEMQMDTEKNDFKDERRLMDLKTVTAMQTKRNFDSFQNQEISDKNNNSGGDSESCELDDDASQISFDSNCALDLSVMSSYQPPSHVTLEALQNTKVAVAQFAATAIAGSRNYNEAIKDLAVVQSTLFNLHHQQMLQIQMIHELQSRLSTNQREGANSCDVPNQEKDENEEKHETFKEIEKNNKVQSEMDKEKKAEENTSFLSVEREKFERKKEVPDEKEKTQPFMTKSGGGGFKNFPTKHDFDKKASSTECVPQPSLCHISSSLASSIITNHDPLPPPDEPNSLEMLQKRTQEVLDSASQGILATNLADEIALRKDNMSHSGQGKNEPFFKHRCRYCGKVFGSDSALQIHIRSHTGERPFQCDVCGSKFTTKGNLKVHYQRHTQRYPIGPMGPIPEYLDNYNVFLAQSPDQVPPLYPSNVPVNRSTGQHPSNFSNFGNPPNFRPPIEFPKLPELHLKEKKNFEEEQEEPTDLSKPSKSVIKTSLCDERGSDDSKSELNTSKPQTKMEIFQNSPNFSKEPPVEEKKDSEEVVRKNTPREQSSSSSSTNSNTSSDVIAELPSMASMITNATQNDRSWESLIEISKTSETSKLQQLVDNIENKLADPNQCVFCQKILSCRSALQMHYRTHTGERPYRCRICGRAFATKGNLKAHMIIHKIKPPMRSQFKCPVCHNKFSNSLTLQEHIRTHTKETIEEFHKKALELIDDKNLMQSPSTGETTISENSEQKSESSQGDYDDYMEVDDDEDDDRNFIENTENDMKNEFKTYPVPENKRSPSNSSDSALDLTPRAKITQNTCENDTLDPLQGMSKFQRFLSYTQMALPNSPVYIPSNPLSSMSKAVIPPTSFNHLGLIGIRSNTTCNICCKTFACTSALEIHFRSHTKERPFKCSICDRAFSTKKEESLHTSLHYSSRNGNLKQHFLTHKHCEASSLQGFSNSNHSEDESSSCSISQQLQSPPISHHQISPLTPRQFEDEHQNFQFPGVQEDCTKEDEDDRQGPKLTLSEIEQQSHPKRHIDPSDSINLTPSSQSSSTETESSNSSQNFIKENSHSQNYCPVNFNVDQSINMKHLCTVCRKNFSSSSALQIHMRTHTGDKPFRCNICQKAFTTKGNLKVHMSTHMWTNGASTRGRRMSLEFPVGRPMGSHLSDTDYLPRRPDLFYPYIPPILNGMQHKLGELRPLQTGNFSGLTPLPPTMPGKYSGLFGFSPFLPNSPSGLHPFQTSYPNDASMSQETSINVPAINTSKENLEINERKSILCDTRPNQKITEIKDIVFDQNMGNLNILRADKRKEGLAV